MKLLYSLTFLLLSTLALAQPGALDKTYGTDSGFGSAGIDFSDAVTVAVRQSDNSIVVGGDFFTVNGVVVRVVRFKPDGTIDSNYGPVVAVGFTYAMAIQADDKVIVAGLSNNGSISRLNTDGSIDETFKTNIGTGVLNDAAASIRAVAVQPDGKILVAGGFTQFNGVTRPRIARLNSDGTLDDTFNPGEGPDGPVGTINFQSNGKIIITGGFKKYDGADRNFVARLNTDGTLDGSFNPNGFSSSSIVQIQKVLITSDDEIIMGGAFQQYGGETRYQLLKTDVNGELDTDFTSPLPQGVNVLGMAFHPDNKLMIGGMLPNIYRVNLADGWLDDTFTKYPGNTDNTGGSNVYVIQVQEDGKIFIGGSFKKVNGTARNRVARLLPNGYLEGGRGADGPVNASVLLPNGTQLIAGDFIGFRGIGRGRITQVSKSGFMSDSFDPAEGANGPINAVAVDANGKIIIAGDFTRYRGVDRNRIARINADGTLDDTFFPDAGANTIVRTIAIQDDGAILIGGDFTAYNGFAANHIVRVEPDGGHDETFDIGTGADGNVQSIALQSDGKIVATGNFNNYNGVASKRIVRINTDGSLDDTFDIGTGADSPIYAVKVDEDDNIYIGGSFTKYNNVTRNGIARLTADGTLDQTFDPGTKNYTTVRTITIMSTGNVFIGGEFSNKIALLSNTGVTDPEFYPVVNPDGSVFTSLESEGQIIVGGQFTKYDNVNVDRLARLLNSGKRDQTITFGLLPTDKRMGDQSFELTATASSTLPVTFSSSDETVATVDGNTVTIVGAGETTISVNQAGNEKFNAAPAATRILQIAKGQQTMVWDWTGDDLIFEGPSGTEFSLEGAAHSTAGVTPIKYSVGDIKARISDDGTKLVILSVGQNYLYAEQEGNDDWLPAEKIQVTFTMIITEDPDGEDPDGEDPDGEDPDGEDPVTGLEDEDHGIIAYPNPTEGELTIQLPLGVEGEPKAALLNTLGVQVNGGIRQAGQDLKLDLSALPRGMYFVKIQVGSVNTVKRIHRK